MMDGHDTNFAVRKQVYLSSFCVSITSWHFQNIDIVTLAGKVTEKANSAAKFGD